MVKTAKGYLVLMIICAVGYWVSGQAQTWNYFSLLGKVVLSLVQLGFLVAIPYIIYRMVIRLAKNKIKD
jgi:hypothetical protein